MRSLNAIFDTLKEESVFNTSLNYNDYAALKPEEKRNLQIRRARKLYEYQFIENNYGAAFSNTMCMIDWSAGMVYSLNKAVCLLFPFVSS